MHIRQWVSSAEILQQHTRSRALLNNTTTVVHNHTQGGHHLDAGLPDRLKRPLHQVVAACLRHTTAHRQYRRSSSPSNTRQTHAILQRDLGSAPNVASTLPSTRPQTPWRVTAIELCRADAADRRGKCKLTGFLVEHPEDAVARTGNRKGLGSIHKGREVATTRVSGCGGTCGARFVAYI